MKSAFSLEITIKHDSEKFIALCSGFPECSGEGESEQIAIENLSESIATHIKTAAKQTFQTIFSSRHFTQIILDTAKAAKEHRRVYSLDPNDSTIQRSIIFKVKPNEDITQMMEPPQDDIVAFLQNREAMLLQSMTSQMTPLTGRIHAIGQTDGFSFGIPISFN